jgi:carbamate kinase
MSLIVAALGGNAIIKKGEQGTFAQQFRNTYESMGYIAHLIRAGHQVVLTHGNGPQVGQVLVNRDDPAMQHPTKPVGAFYIRERAAELERLGHTVVEDSGRGWRRVVPSPRPIRIIETNIIKELVQAGTIVVACGGGGIPVAEANGALMGVDAVIDKDLASSLLAVEIKADVLMFLTTVDRVALNYNTPQQVDLERLSLAEARQYLSEGQFPPGSMGPKIEAAVEFVESGGERAVVCRPEYVVEALSGRAGTVIE